MEVLPKIEVSEIPRSREYEPVSVQRLSDGRPLYVSAAETNGLVYVRAHCDLADLPSDLQLFVPLFCSVRCFLQLLLLICILHVSHNPSCEISLGGWPSVHYKAHL